MNEKEKMQRLEDDEESNGESESGFKQYWKIMKQSKDSFISIDYEQTYNSIRLNGLLFSLGCIFLFIEHRILSLTWKTDDF